jgi:hypothetical protein
MHETTEIKVINAIVTCETTVIICSECKKELSEPKTEC